MSLTPLQTLHETLETALDYEETGSVTKAKTVITTCKRLLARKPTSISGGGSSQGYDAASLEKIEKTARLWLQANDTASNSRGGVRYLNMGRYRG